MWRCSSHTYKNAADCDNLCQQVAEVNIVTSGFDRKLLKAGKGLESIWSVLFQRNLFKVLQSRAQLERIPDGFTFRADCCDENTSWDDHPTTLALFKSTYCSLQRNVMSSPELSVVWNDSNVERPKSPVGYLQVFTDETVTMLKNTAFVAYLAHADQMNCSANFRRWLIKMNTLWLASWQPGLVVTWNIIFYSRRQVFRVPVYRHG